MNKQIKSLLLCFVMVFAIVATAVPTYAYSTETAEVELSIVPDKTTASPGDTVTYAVNIGPVRRLQSVNFTLVIPDTLEYGVGKEVDGLKDLLGADTAEYTDANKTMIIGGGGSYNCDSTTPLMKFTCTVKSSTPNGEVEIGIMDDWDIADDEWETYPNVKINTAASIVTIVSPSKPATAISLNKDTLSLVVGNSETLTATLTPANSTDKVTWTSSADSIATVDENGVVTAVTEGTATITAKANDDVSAMCVVTVEKATCKHEHKTEHPAVASTCIMLGHNQYYTCDDCGKVFKADGVTETTVEAEMLTEYGAHVQKIPATCTAKAICEVCGQAYGELADHVFTEKIEDEAHLASAGDCQTHKTYYYDCANCDLKGEETFESESYGDHKLSEVWTTENGKHFHACTVSGCTYKADEAACSGGTATCTNRAVCSVCLKEYGELAPHDYKTEWNQGDENGHWHDCKNCSAHDKQQAHNPGAEATETEPQTCTECGYVIKPATGHIKHTADTSKWLYDETSHWHKCVGCDEKLDVEKHHGGNATCTAKAICEVCAQAYGELADHIDANNDNKCDNCGKEMHEHTFSTAWSYDEAYHWHKSTCGHDDIVADKAAHTASAWIVDMEATYRNAGRMHKECVTCGYILDTAVIPASDPSQAPWWGITNRPETARKYTLTATAGHGGSITNEGTYTILADLDLTYTITPMRGYTIESVFVDGRDMGAITEYTFRNVKANHTISATFRKSFENPFIDIFESDRYYDAVAFVYENGLFKGVSAREFAPDTTMTRAMFVTVLGRLANVNADMYNTVSFDDVEAGSWYAPYVQWACDAGIVNGYGDGKFGVNDPVTVEQAAVLLARFAAYSGIQTVNYTALSGFTDAATVSDWAVAPMQFVVGNGIYTGAANALEPQSPAKRSLLAEMLYAYVMHFGE